MGFFGKKKPGTGAEKEVAPVKEEPTPVAPASEPEAAAPEPPVAAAPVEEAPAPATTETRDPPVEASSNVPSSEPTSSSAHAGEEQPNEEDLDEGSDAGQQEWDEGGPSHCGYHETVHATLMSVGESVHSFVGDPPEGMQSGMKQVGNWFQEASYATRDFIRGDQAVNDDAGDTLSTMKANLTEIMTGSPTNAGDVAAEEKKPTEDTPATSSAP